MYSSVTLRSTPLNSHINIYLRNYKKLAVLIPIPIPVKNHELQQIVASRFRLAGERLAVFANGQRIDPLAQREIELKEKSIVHVVQLDRTELEKLTIYFKYPNEAASCIAVETTPQTQIRSIFQQIITPFFGKGEKEIFFAYLGRPINIFKTFEEELVEHECEILILEFKPSKMKCFETINQSQESKHVSIASTKMLGMPVLGGRDRPSLKMQKEKMALNNLSKMHPSFSIKEESAPPELEKLESIKNSGGKKVEELKLTESAAPEIDHLLIESAPKAYYGFDPHTSQAAPTKSTPEVKPESPPPKIAKQQISPSPSPSPTILQPKDLLFMGSSLMQQADNFSAGAIQEYKQNFLKKKGSSNSGKQNKMITHY